MEVLSCPHHEAEFYMESTAWDIQTAVLLWLENNPAPESVSNRGMSLRSIANPYNPLYNLAAGGSTNASSIIPTTSAVGASSSSRRITKRWARREVKIEGLSDEWMAKVSAYEGVIYFVNRITGKSQRQVPRGFADVEDVLIAKKRRNQTENEGDAAMNEEGESEPVQESEAAMEEEEGLGTAPGDDEDNIGSGTPVEMQSGAPFVVHADRMFQSRSFVNTDEEGVGLSESERLEDYAVMASFWGVNDANSAILQAQQAAEAAMTAAAVAAAAESLARQEAEASEMTDNTGLMGEISSTRSVAGSCADSESQEMEANEDERSRNEDDI